MPKQTDDTNPKGSLTPSVRQRVIAMYKADAPLNEITKTTGVPRATIYWILQQENIRPNRLNTRGDDEVLTIAQALERWRVTEAENTLLRARIVQLEAVVDYTYERLGISPKVAYKVLGKEAPRTAPVRPRGQAV